MVGVIELESMTSTMSTWRSNQLSYTPSNGMLPNIPSEVMLFKSFFAKNVKNYCFFNGITSGCRLENSCSADKVSGNLEKTPDLCVKIIPAVFMGICREAA